MRIFKTHYKARVPHGTTFVFWQPDIFAFPIHNGVVMNIWIGRDSYMWTKCSPTMSGDWFLCMWLIMFNRSAWVNSRCECNFITKMIREGIRAFNVYLILFCVWSTVLLHLDHQKASKLALLIITYINLYWSLLNTGDLSQSFLNIHISYSNVVILWSTLRTLWKSLGFGSFYFHLLKMSIFLFLFYLSDVSVSLFLTWESTWKRRRWWSEV